MCKGNGPGKAGRFPIATPGRKAPKTPHKLSEGNRGRYDVSGLPNRESFFSDIQQRCHDCAEKPAVKYESPVPYADDFNRVVCKGRPFNHDIEYSGPCDSSDKNVETEVQDLIGIFTNPPRFFERQAYGREESHGYKNAICVEGKWTYVKEDGMHIRSFATVRSGTICRLPPRLHCQRC